MKVILATLLFFLSFNVLSQSWCEAGSNWKYSYINVGAEGYTEIEYIGDTTISGQPSKILDKHLYTYDYVLSQTEDFDLGQEYTYENNGVVYLWYDNSWDTLYNFNATIGESWRMAKQPITNACDSNSILTVTATGTKIINSLALNYLVVEFSFPSGFSDTIVEKIGFTGSYMLPYDGCDVELDANEGGEFRCFSDDNFTTYKPHFTDNCDFIVGLNELNSKFNIQIIPNPASTKIKLIGVDDQNVIIQDLQGKSCSFKRIGNTIFIDHLPNGIYVLSILSKQGFNHKRFIKQ